MVFATGIVVIALNSRPFARRLLRDQIGSYRILAYTQSLGLLVVALTSISVLTNIDFNEKDRYDDLQQLNHIIDKNLSVTALIPPDRTSMLTARIGFYIYPNNFPGSDTVVLSKSGTGANLDDSSLIAAESDILSSGDIQIFENDSYRVFGKP
jgi:hypothetical protein